MRVLILARKPLDQNVVLSCLTHGAGCINIEETRIRVSSTPPPSTDPSSLPSGRYPANVILSSTQVAALDRMTAHLHGRGNVNPEVRGGSGIGTQGLHGFLSPAWDYKDSGGASRFFAIVEG